MAVLLVWSSNQPVYAALPEGSNAPQFETQASLDGRSFQYALKDELKKGAVVVYFYPSAYTGGCNRQAHAFAQNIDKFSAAGATVVGVSLDSIARLNDFSADPQYCAGKVVVASDVDGRIARAYQLSVRDAVQDKKDTRGETVGHGLVERVTFVVTSDGRIAATLSGLAPEVNVTRSLEIVQELSAVKAGW